MWKFCYVTSIFKKGRRNNVEDYRGVAILFAIPKHFELLIYSIMYDDLKNLISVNQHGLMKNRSTATNLLEYASFVLNSIEEGWKVDSVYTDFMPSTVTEGGVSRYQTCSMAKILFDRGVISDHCVLFGLSTEYR
jgi:hypothetical protein